MFLYQAFGMRTRRLFIYESVNRIDHILYRCNFELFVRDFDFEFILDIEHEFDLVQRIEAQEFKGGLGLKLFNVKINLLIKSFLSLSSVDMNTP